MHDVQLANTRVKTVECLYNDIQSRVTTPRHLIRLEIKLATAHLEDMSVNTATACGFRKTCHHQEVIGTGNVFCSNRFNPCIYIAFLF